MQSQSAAKYGPCSQSVSQPAVRWYFDCCCFGWLIKVAHRSWLPLEHSLAQAQLLQSVVSPSSTPSHLSYHHLKVSPSSHTQNVHNTNHRHCESKDNQDWSSRTNHRSFHFSFSQLDCWQCSMISTCGYFHGKNTFHR